MSTRGRSSAADWNSPKPWWLNPRMRFESVQRDGIGLTRISDSIAWALRRMPDNARLDQSRRAGELETRHIEFDTGPSTLLHRIRFKPMHKVNIREIPQPSWTSPKGKYASIDQELSIALGRKPDSTDIRERHPFDIEICRIPPGKAACPYHSHSAQWEFYHVISGTGQVRDETGCTPITAGDVFLFGPGEAHQLINDGEAELVLYLVADNPVGETCYYPDSHKWMVRSPERRLIRSEPVDYLDGEE